MPYREQAERLEGGKVWYVRVSPSVFRDTWFKGPFGGKRRAWLWAWWFCQMNSHAACWVEHDYLPMGEAALVIA